MRLPWQHREDDEWGDVTVIEWLDTWTAEDTWLDLDDCEATPYPVRTVGYVFQEDDDYVSVVSSLTPFRRGFHVTHIPRGMIRERRTIGR